MSGVDARAGFFNFFKRQSLKWSLEELSVSTHRINFSSEELFVPFIQEIILGNSSLKLLDLSKVDFFLGYQNLRDTLGLELKIYQSTVFCNK